MTDELNITMIPNQKDGKPGQYLKPSMLISMAASAPDPDAAAKLMSFFITDEAANDILLIERGVSGDASIRERITGKLSDTEKKIIDYLDVVGDACRPAAAAAAEERRRARPRAAPAWELVAFKKVDVKQAAKDYYENAKAVLERA